MPIPTPQLNFQNPYITGHDNTAGAAVSLANALNSAAQQQQQYQDAQRRQGIADDQRQFENERQLQKDGYVPAQTYPNGDPAPGRPTLQTPEDNPQAQGGGPSTVEPQSGRRYVQKPALDDTNSFPLTDEIRAMASEYGVNLPANGRAPFSLLGSLHTAAELHKMQHPDPETQSPDPAIQATGPDGKRVLLNRGAKSGKLSLAQFPEGTSYAPPEKAERPDASQVIPGQQGPNGGLVVFDKTNQSTSEVPLPPGSKPQMTASQTEADKDRHEREGVAKDARAQLEEDRQERNNERDRKTHDEYLTKESIQKGVAQGYWDARGTPDGGVYRSPRVVNGVITEGPQALMPKGKDDNGKNLSDPVRARLRTLATEAENQARQNNKSAQQIRSQHGWGEFAAQGGNTPQAGASQQGGNSPAAATQKPAVPAAQPAAARPAAPAQPAGKKYTASEIATWAKQNGKLVTDAMQRAKKAGILQ